MPEITREEFRFALHKAELAAEVLEYKFNQRMVEISAAHNRAVTSLHAEWKEMLKPYKTQVKFLFKEAKKSEFDHKDQYSQEFLQRLARRENNRLLGSNSD